MGFSKFAELRPKHCVLAGASGTHSVCVCTIHQNVKLMINGAGLPVLFKDGEVLLDTYHNCLAQLICNLPLPRCYLGCCQYCPGTSKLKHHLQTLLEEHMIDEIVYKQWHQLTGLPLNLFVIHLMQARSQGGFGGFGRAALLGKRSTISVKRSTILAKRSTILVYKSKFSVAKVH